MSLIEWFRRQYVHLYQRAEKYNVSPFVFLILYFSSLLPYYLGIYFILRGSGLLSVNLSDLIHFDFSGLDINNTLAVGGLCINRLAWALPYLYIEMVGKGLHWYIHLGIWAWISGSISYLVCSNFC